MTSSSLLLLRTSSCYFNGRYCHCRRSLSSLFRSRQREQPLPQQPIHPAKKCRLSSFHGSGRTSTSFHSAAAAANSSTSAAAAATEAGNGAIPWIPTILLSAFASVVGSTSFVDDDGDQKVIMDDTKKTKTNYHPDHHRRTTTASSEMESSSFLLFPTLSTWLQRGGHPYEYIMDPNGKYEEETIIFTKDQGDIDDQTSSYHLRPYEMSRSAMKGLRDHMEDEYDVNDGGRFFAVFDGHGGNGVSRYLKKHLYAKYKQWEQEALQHDDEEVETKTEEQEDDKPAATSSFFSSFLPNWMIGSKKQADDESTTSTTTISSLPLSPSLPSSLSCHERALRSAFADIEKEVINNRNIRSQGSTAVAILLHEGDIDDHDQDNGSQENHEVNHQHRSNQKKRCKNRTIIAANVGDSRAVLSRNGRAVPLTKDHKPNEAREKQRIIEMGGVIEWDRTCRVHRVQNLSLSRAIGDYWAKPVVSSEVEIQCYPLLDVDDDATTSRPRTNHEDDDDNYGCGYGDQFVVAASDGLWDVMTSQDVVRYVHNVMAYELQQYHLDYDQYYYSRDDDKYYYDKYKRLLRHHMARYITQEAIRRGSGDNVCVVMVWLNNDDDTNGM